MKRQTEGQEELADQLHLGVFDQPTAGDKDHPAWHWW